MNTKERLDVYITLHGEKAVQFFEENSGDETFVSLAGIWNRALTNILEYVQTYEQIVGPLDQTSEYTSFMCMLGDLIPVKSKKKPSP